MVRKSKEEALETRNQILDAAEDIFLLKGVSGATLNDIAKLAGLTRGAIYWHFKNKLDLFDAMMKRVTLPMEEFVGRSDDEQLEDPLAHVRASALNVMRSLALELRTRKVFEITLLKLELVDELLPLRERRLQSRSGCISKIEAGFYNAVRKGQLPAQVNARQAAVGLHALIDGLIVNWVLNPEAFELMPQAEFAVDCYLAGLSQRAYTRPVTGIPAP